jgi:Flp pilus assembly protein TadD
MAAARAEDHPVRVYAALLVLSIAGCKASSEVGPYASAAVERRDTSAAETLNREAADKLTDDPEAAEALLREALTRDLFFGPAHNNLGVIHLNRGELYEAASEFEWARKLLPGSPDPRINLAITLERAGRTSDAMAAYKTALEVQPGCVVAMQGAAVLAVRSGRDDPALVTWLKEIALSGETPEFREWASQRLARRP